MNTLIKYGACAALFMLSSCWSPRIDEKYAAATVQNELSLSGNISAQKLSGGFSGTMNFLVSDALKKYVVRFIENGPHREVEVFNFKIASHGGYGPHVYLADSSRGIVIMEYLSGKKISYEDMQSDQLYVALAHLLLKIHSGPAFKNSGYNVFKRIEHAIQINKPKNSAYIPLAKIEQIITIIHQTLSPHLIKSIPCHNDLHKGNLVFTENEFKAIDYGDAAQGDPYYDVATVANATSFFATPAHERILLATYLERQPTRTEEAKLYLMKQVVWIKWAFDTLYRLRLSPEIIHQYELLKVPVLTELAREESYGTFDLSKSEDNLKLLKVLINQIFDNFESQNFGNAVSLLKKMKQNEERKDY